jgi:O-antigen ligase
VLLIYLLVVALGYSGWTYFVLPPRSGLENPYYSSEYAYKVIKGMVWGIALVPMWGYLLAVDKQRAVNMLVTGMSCAALALGLIVLWERGTLGVILSGSAWYHLVSSLLDLSSSYRVTGIFSDMHTGGEAFDGVVLLLLPSGLYAVAYGRAIWLRTLGAVATLTLAYVTLVGFTRTTYAAFAIALVLYSALTLLSRYKNRMPLPVPLMALSAALGTGLLAAIIAYHFAGSYGLASYGALLVLAYGDSRWPLPQWARYLVNGLALGLVALAVNAHFSSRWVEPSIIGALFIGVSLVASYVFAHKLFVVAAATGEMTRLLMLAGVLLLPLIFAFALGGYQINDRASRISGDLETRKDHWRDVIDSAGSGLLTGLLGNGVGHFPANYISRHPETVKNVGSFRVASEDNLDVLRMGGGQDLTLGQRVSVEPHAIYTVNLHLRAHQPGRLAIALCERNLIYASNFFPNCALKNVSFEATGGAFERQTFEIESQLVGERGALGRWPTVMTIKFDAPDTLIEIDAIELSADGFNLLRNSSFAHGLDYWFSYNDYYHLPWHVKNTFLQVWFESGWLGVALFLVLFALLVRTNLARHSHDSLLPIYTTGVLTVCVFGLFGSPLDSARVSWLFYFFLVSGLASLRVRSGNSRSRRG